jgi:hypothetical protein
LRGGRRSKRRSRSITATKTAQNCPSQRSATVMSRSVKAHCFVSLILLFLAVCSGTSGSTSSSSGTEGDATLSAQGSGRTLALIQLLGEWWNTPPQPLVVQPLLPAARPHQPWPYRPLSSAAHAAVAGTDSYALVATVQHAPLQGEGATMASAASPPAALCSYHCVVTDFRHHV